MDIALQKNFLVFQAERAKVFQEPFSLIPFFLKKRK